MFISRQELEQDPIILQCPLTLVKAYTEEATSNRFVEVEVSNETMDPEGDIITQKALMDAAPTFVRYGHIDIDHYSELGHNPAYRWLGIVNPDDYIIGHPIDVFDLGEKRTGMRAMIKKNENGIVDPKRYKWDDFWLSLTQDPPTRWFASIYGYPIDYEEGTVAKRFLVKAIKWNSTAFTRRPVNETLIGTAHIVAKAGLAIPNLVLAKSYAAAMAINKSGENQGLNDITRDSLRSEFKLHLTKDCRCVENPDSVAVFEMRDHFMKCRHMAYELADLCALATAELFNQIVEPMFGISQRKQALQ